MAATIEFFTVRDQPGPVWARTYGLSADGTILLPAVAVNATDAHAFLCGYHDGITVGRCHRRGYYPSDWLKREWPNYKAEIEQREKQIREYHSGAPTQEVKQPNKEN
jgi:hypothetical protein